MQPKIMTLPPPEPNWESLFKFIFAWIGTIVGFLIAVDWYLKHVSKQKAEANKLIQLEKEAFIKTVVNSAVKVAMNSVNHNISEIHDDVKEIKKNREADMQYFQKVVTDIYRDKK